MYKIGREVMRIKEHYLMGCCLDENCYAKYSKIFISKRNVWQSVKTLTIFELRD